MFAINHAASALIFKKHLNDQVSFVWILLAVQFVELLWVVFNVLGIERTTTQDTVRYVGDIHLSHMPYSHSVLSSIVLTIGVGLAFWLWKRSWKIGIGMGLAVLSHILLDILTHAKDLPLGFSNTHFIGMGLYENKPIVGFLVELTFGVGCWWYYKGNKTLLWVIILFNISNISMFIPDLPGLEVFMAHRPKMITLVILSQILVTLWLVGWLSSKKKVYKQDVPAIYYP